jgi:ubiquinone/menaquinone biosynthesis C-methylase UbiE
MSTLVAATEKTRDEIAAAYDSPPWWYDVRGFFILTFAYNSTLTRQLRFFGANIGPEHLDVACGTGTLLDLVLKYRALKRLPAGRVAGIDYAEPMLAGAIRRFRGNPNVTLRHADATQMPFANATFDTVNIANALHCFPDVDGVLRDVRRVLKPGGTLAVNALLWPRGAWPFKPIAERLDDWGMRKGILYKPFHLEEVRQRIAAAGLETVTERVAGNCVDVVARRA